MDNGFYEDACFYSQQSSEKALKSLLYAKGYRAIITHSTKELFRMCKKLITGIKDLEDETRELDRHYIPPRYPNAFPSGAPYEYYNKEDAEKCINYAESILNEVKKLMRNLETL
ncbi:MAG: HEPN domain-containing protein [Methanosarcinales archaeon]